MRKCIEKKSHFFSLSKWVYFLSKWEQNQIFQIFRMIFPSAGFYFHISISSVVQIWYEKYNDTFGAQYCLFNIVKKSPQSQTRMGGGKLNIGQNWVSGWTIESKRTISCHTTGKNKCFFCMTFLRFLLTLVATRIFFKISMKMKHEIWNIRQLKKISFPWKAHFESVLY